MKTFAQLRERLDEVNFKQDMKKNHISSTKIKNTEVHYHAEKKGSKKIRVFVKPKSAKEFEELGGKTLADIDKEIAELEA